MVLLFLFINLHYKMLLLIKNEFKYWEFNEEDNNKIK